MDIKAMVAERDELWERLEKLKEATKEVRDALKVKEEEILSAIRGAPLFDTETGEIVDDEQD